jgi:biopolymer transport protein ExbB/TolQ
MGFTATLDNYGKPAWIALMVVSFVLFWPIGLAVLFYLIGSGRMSCWKHQRRWKQQWKEHMQAGMAAWHRDQSSSGNRAFDEYREETLRRLEEEQKAFKDFLDRLRHAKDKAEFDQFMAERRHPDPGPQPQPQA